MTLDVSDRSNRRQERWQSPGAATAPRTLKILAITSNLQQASSRLRIAALLDPLAKRGIDLNLRPLPRHISARRDVLRCARDYDAVILHRKLLDPWNIALLKRNARRIIFDVDDAVMHHPRRAGWFSRWRTSTRFATTLAAIDYVVAGNEHLAAIFRSRGHAVSVLPTTIDHTGYPLKQHAPTSTPRLVWIGSRSTARYLRQFLPFIERAVEMVPGLRLVTICDEPISSRLLPIDHVQWTLEDEAANLAMGDIGIAPTPLSPWTLRKCGFKILQYMAAGLPVIASPVGANAALVKPGVSGILAAQPADWPAAIAALSQDHHLRQRMGEAGRAIVEQHYSIERVADAWAAILRD